MYYVVTEWSLSKPEVQVKNKLILYFLRKKYYFVINKLVCLLPEYLSSTLSIQRIQSKSGSIYYLLIVDHFKPVPHKADQVYSFERCWRSTVLFFSPQTTFVNVKQNNGFFLLLIIHISSRRVCKRYCLDVSVIIISRAHKEFLIFFF